VNCLGEQATVVYLLIPAFPDAARKHRGEVRGHLRGAAVLDKVSDETAVSGLVKISCSASHNVNAAFYQNAVPIVRELVVENETTEELSEITVHLIAEPPFMLPDVWRIDRIAQQTAHHLRLVDLKLDPAFLSGVNASQRGEIRVRVDARRYRRRACRPGERPSAIVLGRRQLGARAPCGIRTTDGSERRCHPA
jgi:hypothetical protein